MSSNGSLIQLQGIKKVFYTDEVETHALSEVHLDIKQGDYVSIAGPSGCGKTTLLSILGLLDTPTYGSYLLERKPVANLSAADRARIRNRRIGFIFQAFNLIGDLTVYENVELPLTYRGMARAERKQRVQAALERVSMSRRAKHYPAQLSGGQQQRVAVARAVVGDPAILLADEPTGNLDSTNGEAVMELLRELHRGGATVCMVTHDPRYARYADRTVQLFDGRVVDERAVKGSGDRGLSLPQQDLHWSDAGLRKAGDQLVLKRYGPPGVVVNDKMEIVSLKALSEDLHRRGEPFEYSRRAAEILRHRFICDVVRRFTPGPERLLDVGSSLGQLTVQLARLPQTLVATDVSRTAVRTTREKLRGSPVRAHCVVASATALPFRATQFDVVVLADGLNSWNLSADAGRRALVETHRVVKAGGCALLTEYLRPTGFPDFVAQIGASPLQVASIEYLHDRLWYQVESWFKAVRSRGWVQRLLASVPLALALRFIARPFGSRGSRHICVVARRTSGRG